VIDLGYEPQWVMIKRTDAATSWFVHDNMRGMTYESNTATWLVPNTSAAEVNNTTTDAVMPTATGFQIGAAGANWNESGGTYIYIAIRRGPMKVPTTGTSVFSPNLETSSSTPLSVTTNFPVDLSILRYGPSTSQNYAFDRLRGAGSASGVCSLTNSTSAEITATTFTVGMQSNTSVIDYAFLAGNSTAKIYWNFRRAPGFFDEVCYTGDSTNSRAITLAYTPPSDANLGNTLTIVKSRSGTSDWYVGSYATANDTNLDLRLNTTAANNGTQYVGISGAFLRVGLNGSGSLVNASGVNYVAYIFYSCPGVSKVGSYTGNGSSQTLNMGFTGGARFFLVKRTDNTGDWWVYDSARGIVSSSDPALRLNSTAAEVTSADAVDTDSTGLIVNQESTCNINVNGATYIYLGIA
jgi:hypothetical protein